jgi:hypothetical protein
MAELALQLKIFVASSGDVAAEREAAFKEIQRLSERTARRRLLLQPFLWEHHARPAAGRPQGTINPYLAEAELTVAIFWSRVGSELRLALEQVASGSSDEVFVYFKTADPPPEASGVEVEACREFKRAIKTSRRLLAFEFDTLDQFQKLFSRHLESWTERWYDVPNICECTIAHSPPASISSIERGESRLTAIRASFDYEREVTLTEALGRIAVTSYQSLGPTAVSKALDLKAAGLSNGDWRSLVDTNGNGVEHVLSRLSGRTFSGGRPLREECKYVYFNNEEWFSFFRAAGLAAAVAEGRVDAVDRRPYPNAVHQYLQVLAQKNYPQVVAVLKRWLLNVENCTRGKPMARNFAAYVLGMIGASEAHCDLARAACEDQGIGVQMYCITSLGKLRARPQLPLLVNLYNDSPETETRLTIGQAICRMVGILRYEL